MPDMLPLYRAEALRAMDREAVESLGIPAHELMCRAGAAAWALLRAQWSQARRIGVACGPGNNGGDGYVLARLARAEGFTVHAIAPSGGHPRRDPARQALAEWRAAGGRVEAFDGALPEVDVWVDALYGIGLSKAPTGVPRELIERINASRRPVLSLDVPSGLDADRGHAPGAAIRAQATISFIAAKPGLFTGQGCDLAGTVHQARLGLPPLDPALQPPAAWRVREAALSAWLAPRHPNAHKGEHGHVLCVGGELGMGGAVRLCAEAALRTGVGLASVATRQAGVAALVAARPEAMTHAVEDAAALRPLLERATVVAVGPGLGQGGWGRALLEATFAAGKPLVLDADALNLLANAPRELPGAVLTPHPGEAARLLGQPTADVQADRFAAAAAMARRYACTAVLKGAGTVVAGHGEVPVVIGAGNPGMATGGMGDVLSGVVAALLAQGLAPFEAAVAGALLHGAAGDAAARVDGERGLLPSDLFPHLRRLANPQ